MRVLSFFFQKFFCPNSLDRYVPFQGASKRICPASSIRRIGGILDQLSPGKNLGTPKILGKLARDLTRHTTEHAPKRWRFGREIPGYFREI